jgi:8-oxo-dGTP pyrophosphatase MutT (NUDIX family)
MSGETTVPFSTPWFDIQAAKVDDSEAPYYYLRLPDYVTVVAATSRKSVLMVRQYRPAVQCHVLELPSGTIEPGEPPEDAARRELAEETGYHAQDLTLLGTLLPDCGRLSNKLWCYHARDVVPLAEWKPEDGIEVVECSPAELIACIRQGEFHHALNVAAVLLAVLQGHLKASI